MDAYLIKVLGYATLGGMAAIYAVKLGCVYFGLPL